MKKLRFTIMAVLGLMAVTVSNAFAYLPSAAVIDPMYAEVTTDVTTLSDKAWPIAFMVTGITIAFGLFKKFTRRAAS